MAKGDFKKRYDELLSTRDYRGLADLLRNSNYDSYDARNRAYSMADKFEEEADITDRLLEGSTQKQRDAYNFVANGPTKSLDHNVETDYYSKTFSDAWNGMANDSNEIILTNIGENALNGFIQGSGINLDNFSSYGITRGNNTISIKTDNNNKIAIYKGIDNVIKQYVEGVNSGIYNDRTYYNEAVNHFINIYNTNAYKNRNQNEFSPGIINPFITLRNTVEEANNSYYEVMTKTNPYILQSVVTGYMGEDDKQLQQAFSAGAMDLQTFKEARSLLEEKYNRILQTKDLSQYNVYTMNEDNNGSHLLEKLEDNILKAQLDEEINLAMAENRLHFSHASNGLMYGTMITIDQRQDTKKNPMEEYPTRRFFVQDLFKSEAENSLRQDTQSDAMLQYARHQTYGHIYRAKDGGRIENWDGMLDAAQYTDEYGNSRIISKAEILDIMDNDIITRRLIDYYKRANLRSNINGNLYTEEGYQVFGGNKFDYNVLITNIKQKSIQAMAAKYGNPNSDYVKVKANKLASTIIQMLGLDLTDDESLENK